jgi:ubiquitin C-terminal hydrolase
MISYNAKLISQPKGFPNPRNIRCYWNSSLQALLSCTAFIENISGTYMEHISNDSEELYKKMVEKLYSAGKSREYLMEFIHEQRCAAEAIGNLIESLENHKNLMNIFMHKYKRIIKCLDCQQIISKKEAINYLFETELNSLINIDMFLSNLLNQYEYIEGFKCEKCQSESPKLSIRNLCLVPDILIFVLKKYQYHDGIGKKINTICQMPTEFTIGSKKLRYRAVAQIEHVGNLYDGHYWCICMRPTSEGKEKWYKIDDDIVEEVSGLHISSFTYIVIYHYWKDDNII